MEQTATVLELVEAKDIGRLTRYILQTDVLLEHRDLAYRLWDAFLPPFERQRGSRFPISDVTMDQIKNDIRRSLHSMQGSSHEIYIHAYMTDIGKDRIAFDREKLGKLLVLFFETPYYNDESGVQHELHYYQVQQGIILPYNALRASMTLPPY